MHVSIITINYNNKAGLTKTIESVISQDYSQFEFIVIDGGSTDGSVEIIKKHKKHINYWVSEPDRGIYHAMNKGIFAAKGEYCNFMNSGDYFCDSHVLTSVFQKGDSANIICGNTFTTEWIKAPKSITMSFLFNQTICHQCAFIKRQLLLKYNYDENLKIVADRKFFIQALVFENCSYKAIDVNVVNYDLSGFSSQNRVLSDLEYQKVLEQLIPERIRIDYGTKFKGLLHDSTYYDKLFYEISKRNYRKYIYTMSVLFFKFISIFKKSARFIRFYPIKL